MRDLIPAPFLVALVAQIPAAPWDQLTISGIGIGATIFLWRYFTAKEAEAKKELDAAALVRETADKDESNRLRQVQNALQKQVVDLLREQVEAAKLVASKLESTPVKSIVVNDVDHPVPNAPVK